MSTVETLHNKFVSKLDTLEEYVEYVGKVVDAFQDSTPDNSSSEVRLKNYAKYMDAIISSGDVSGVTPLSNKIDGLIVEAARLKASYNSGASPILSLYYDNEEVYEQYREFITSENIIDQMDQCMRDTQQVVRRVQKQRGFKKFTRTKIKVEESQDPLAKLFASFSTEVETTDAPNPPFKDFNNVTKDYVTKYNQSKITIQTKVDSINECTECKGHMTIFQDTSELRCDDCAITIKLKGTVFEDSQFYTQQGQCTKHKKYDAKRHCRKWLDQIQAKENKTFSEIELVKLNDKAKLFYTKNGRLRPMTGMKCKNVRVWLKELDLTTYNQHAPLLRKMITSQNGKAIVPPQLKFDEEQRILVLFSQAMDIYDEYMEEKIANSSKKSRSNKPYYPYVLFKILCIVLPEGTRQRGLIECIHLQSDGTLKNHDMIWQEICARMQKKGEKDFKYCPTDRAILIDGF